MNRDRRRQLDRLGIRWVVAHEACPGCGAPMCPDCGDEAHVCSCCGEFNCDRCGHYLVGPRPSTGGTRGAAAPGVSRESPPAPVALGELDQELLRRVQNELDG